MSRQPENFGLYSNSALVEELLDRISSASAAANELEARLARGRNAASRLREAAASVRINFQELLREETKEPL